MYMDIYMCETAPIAVCARRACAAMLTHRLIHIKLVWVQQHDLIHLHQPHNPQAMSTH